MRISKWIALFGSVALIGMLAGCSLFNEAPVVNFMWSPQDPLSRSDVQFSDLSMDVGGLFGGGGIVSWLWDFGDNESSPSQNPKHEYEYGGTYDVRLTVTDDAGTTASLTKKITVTPSIAGVWTGIWTDIWWNTSPMTLTLTHTATGGISGTLSHNGQIWPIIGASFNATSLEVQITASDTILRGTLDQSERRMSGFWYEAIQGWRGEDWSVSLP